MPDASTGIWNRACFAESDEGLEAGDRALRLAIAFTGFSENGGLAHALEVSGLRDTVGATDGLRWFGLGDGAAVVEAAMAMVGRDVLDLDAAGRQEAFHRRLDLDPDPFEELEQRAAEALSQSNLLEAFERRLRSRPKAFLAPADSSGDRQLPGVPGGADEDRADEASLLARAAELGVPVEVRTGPTVRTLGDSKVPRRRLYAHVGPQPPDPAIDSLRWDDSLDGEWFRVDNLAEVELAATLRGRNERRWWRRLFR